MDPKLQFKSKKPFVCIKCHANLDAISLAEDPKTNVQPNDLDITICIYCYAVYRFENGKPNFASPDDIKTWPLHHQFDISVAITKIRAINKQLGRE